MLRTGGAVAIAVGLAVISRAVSSSAALTGGRSRCRSRRRSRSGVGLRRRVSGAAESAVCLPPYRPRPNTPRACRGAVRKSGVWFISPERSAACALATGTRLRPWDSSAGCCQISGIGILAATFPVDRLPLAARSRLFFGRRLIALLRSAVSSSAV